MKTCSRCSILIADDAQLCPECEAAFLNKRNEGIRKIARIVTAIALFLDAVLSTIILLNDDTLYPMGYGAFSIAAAVFIGVLLLIKKKTLVAVVRVLLIVSGIILTLLLSSQNDFSMIALRIVFTVALISLITGIPGKVRFSASAAVIIIFLLSSLILVQESFPGTTIAGRGNNAVHQSRNAHKKRKRRRKSARVSLPHRRWKKSGNRQAGEKHPKALHWLNYPEFDAHVLILMDSVARPDTINTAMYIDSVLTRARTTTPAYMIIDRSPCSNNHGLKGTTVIAHGGRGNKKIFHQYAFFRQENYIFQIFCISNEETFNEVKKDFTKIIHSFKP